MMIRIPERLSHALSRIPALARTMNRYAGRYWYITPEIHFGGCPHCGTQLMRHLKKAHWNTCDEHKTKWEVGWNLFTVPENVWDDDVYEKTYALLSSYETVEPILWMSEIQEAT